jgi:hypothetical protein
MEQAAFRARRGDPRWNGRMLSKNKREVKKEEITVCLVAMRNSKTLCGEFDGEL